MELFMVSWKDKSGYHRRASTNETTAKAMAWDLREELPAAYAVLVKVKRLTPEESLKFTPA